ncbi:MAG: DUF2752 domain-containing protein [Egibacteraceae bacterium]
MLAWTCRDGHRFLTWSAVLGLAAAVLLAAFGMPPVELHGPLHYLGIMGPLCGMTRGVAAFTRGDLALAWAYNPASLLLVPGAAVVIGRAAYGCVTGRWLQARIRFDPRIRTFVVVGVALLTVPQQLHVELLA